MQISITVAGIEAVLAELAAVQQRTGNVTTDLARDTGLIIQAEVDQVFESAPPTESGGTVYGGKTWAKLTDLYLARNPKRIGGQIYRDSGELLGSLAVGGEGNILQADGDSLTFGSALPKAAGLQDQREFLFPTDAMEENIARLWENYVAQGLT